MKISADQSLSQRQFEHNININHAASIQFGRLVERNWKFTSKEQADRCTVAGTEYIILTEQDKSCVRENIMQAIAQQVQNKPIQKQYLRSLKEICLMDYPEKFPNLEGQIKQYLETQGNMLMVYTGMLGLVALVQRYESEVDEEREPLFRII